MTGIKFPYRVKFNGVYYPPETEIDTGNTDKKDNGADVATKAATPAPEKPVRKKTAKPSTAK